MSVVRVSSCAVSVSPVLLGRGEALWSGLDLPALGYEVKACTCGERAAHLLIGRREGRRPCP